MIAALLASLAFGRDPAWPAPGDLDPSFSADGKQLVDFGGRFELAEDVDVYPDGRTIATGSTAASEGARLDIAVVRLLPDGELDPAFAGDGMATFDFGKNESGVGVVALPDGRALVASPAPVSGGNKLTVLRLSNEGSLDPSLGEGGVASTLVEGANAIASDVARAPNDQIVVAGRAHSGSNRDIALARFAPDGSLDASFGNSGTVRLDLGGDERIHALHVDVNGNIVVAGEARPHNPLSPAEVIPSPARTALLARFLPSGALDPSFSEDGLVFENRAFERGFTHLVLSPAGAPTAGGVNTSVGSTGGSYVTSPVLRYGADGAFSLEVEAGGELGGLDLQPDGSIVTASTPRSCSRGSCAERDFHVSSRGPDGALDTAFGESGVVRTDFGGREEAVEGLVLLEDGRIVVAGTSRDDDGVRGDFAIARYVVTPGPRDADADGIAARADRCEAGYAPADAVGCPAGRRSITIIRRKEAVEGVVTAPAECEARGEVRLFRRFAGKTSLVGESGVSSRGSWKIELPPAPGLYRAVARTVFVAAARCERARSAAIRQER